MRQVAAWRRRYFVFCLSLVALAPAKADYLKSVKDREAIPLSSGAKVLVFAAASDLGFSEIIESKFTNRLRKKCDVEAIPSGTLFPPTRTFSDEERAKIIGEAGIEVVLRIALTGSEQLTKNVTVMTSPQTAITRTKGAGMADVFELALIPVGPGPKLWVASAHYEEDDHEENAGDLATDAVADLIKCGLVPQKAKRAR